MATAMDTDALMRLELTPPERTTLDDQVYADLRAQIMSGRLRPGDSLSIRTLAALLDVSPMPVRSALRRLTDEGALEGRPNRTYTIRILSPEEFRDILDMRLLLEGAAAERAAPGLGPDDIAALAAINQQMYGGEPLDTETYLKLNRQFHFHIYARAGSPLMMRVIEMLWLQIGPLLNFVTGESGTRYGHAVHEAALRAAEARDAQALRDAIVTDLREASVPILDWLERRDRG